MFYRKDPSDIKQEAPTPAPETCFEVHEKWHVECDKRDCRNWIEYEDDLNCAVVCSRKHENGLSLREVAERMGVSFPRISQIEHAAFRKLKDAGVFEEE